MKVIEPTAAARLDLLAPAREILAPAEVLAIIEPVDPDNLRHVGGGVYEAVWVDDEEGAAREIAALCRQLPRVVVVSEAPYRPAGLARGAAVQFAVTPLPFTSVETVQ